MWEVAQRARPAGWRESVLAVRNPHRVHDPEVSRARMACGVSVRHTCDPPKEDRPRVEAQEWACPQCGARWRIRVVAEGYRFEPGGGGEPFSYTEWERILDAAK